MVVVVAFREDLGKILSGDLRRMDGGEWNPRWVPLMERHFSLLAEFLE
jgi:hypothetical protein